MGGLTAEFPDDLPERKGPDVKNEFEGATVTDAHMREAEERLKQLESEREKLTSHLDHTYGGTVEQGVHETVSAATAPKREEEIKALQEQLQRNRERNQQRGKNRRK